MKKSTILCLALLVFPLLADAQDLIFKKNGEEINAKVEEISLDAVLYRASSNPNGPIISIPISELLLLKFSNGEKHVFKNTTSKYSLGVEYGGGIIFYIDKSGEHGLIAAKDDIGELIRWGRAQNRVGAASYSDGAKNTETIVANLGSDCAASKCADLTSGGFSDWYLPAIEELYRLYQSRDYVPGLSRPGKNDYCSSTEHINRNDCLGIHFGRGGTQFFYNKREPYHVRAIRKF
jgi:hypothetical protein